MFELVSAELYAFLGFSRPRIEFFKATFENNKLQILNSGNGDGKSTLISELNPFPIQKELFDTDGYKKITFRYDGKLYITESSAKRNFLWDVETGENLNDGGTQTQHVALMKQLFNITPFVWNICMGAINFTHVDKNTRRSWVETISGVNFDYAFEIYRKILSELNSNKGAVKHLNAQLATEASKLLSLEEVEELTETKDLLSGWVKEVLLKRDNSVSIQTKHQIEREIAGLEKAAKDTQRAYNALGRFVNPFSNLNTIESLRDHHHTLQSQIETNKVMTESKIGELEERTKLLSRLQDTKGIDINKVNDELTHWRSTEQDAKAYVSDYREYYPLIAQLSDIEGLKQLLEAIDGFSSNFISKMSLDHGCQDDGIRFELTQETYKNTFTTLQDSRRMVEMYGHRISSAEESLSSLRQSMDVQCPECSTTFSPNLELINKQEAVIRESEPLLKQAQDKVTLLEPKIEYHEAVKAMREELGKLIRQSFSMSHAYLNYIREHYDNFDCLSALSLHLRKDYEVLSEALKVREAAVRITELESLVKEYNIVAGIASPEELNSEVKRLEDEIGNLRKRRSELEAESELLTDTGKTYRKHHELITRLHETLQSLMDKRQRYVGVLENVMLESVENDLQIRLANVTRKVNDNAILTDLIAKLEEMLTKAKDDIETLKVLDAAFNPKTGIIAEQLIGYVEAFAKQITGVIDKLWGYPMVIMPCGIEGKKGMDYQFPFHVGAKPIPDISKGSKSQLSVINLAIMLCTRISLGLNHLPLFLDEVGGGFDTVHDQKLTEFIRELLSDYACSNVFLVHHNAAVRNSLGPHDTIVFDPSHVIVEPGYNQYVEIRRYNESKEIKHG